MTIDLREHLAGLRRMRLVESEGHVTLEFDEAGSGRVCGACQLCCKLMPVPRVLNKPAGVRCRHQRVGKGCMIHARAPVDCQVFSCRWLADASTTTLPRPDRAHYVVDVSLDTVRTVDEEGLEQTLQVLQIWCDPAFPDAHRAPELRAWLAMMAERHGFAALVRYGSYETLTIFAPCFVSTGEWFETKRATVNDFGRLIGSDEAIARLNADRDAAREVLDD